MPSKASVSPLERMQRADARARGLTQRSADAANRPDLSELKAKMTPRKPSRARIPGDSRYVSVDGVRKLTKAAVVHKQAGAPRRSNPSAK